MAEDKRFPPEEQEQQEGKGRLSLHNLFYHNTFVLIFSFVVSVIAWFIMYQYSGESRTYMVYDVPITTLYSSEAEAEGLREFNKSYSTVDVEVSGNSLITSRLTAADFTATISVNPSSSKVTGNTLQRMSVPVRVVKNAAQADYEIVSVNPEEVTVEYDRYKEASFPIEQEITYSAGSGYYAAAPVLSEESVVISGPESSVNKISRVAVSRTLDTPLEESASFSASLKLYDQDNQEITNTGDLYLSSSLESVDVSITVMNRKTVPLTVSTLRQPSNFSSSRITIEPAQIDIAGAKEVLDEIQEIQLDTVVDFGRLDLGQENSFVSDITLPAGVRNLTNVGDNVVSQATVTVNLNGYQQVTVTVPEENIQTANTPAGKEVELTTQTLDVSVIGPEAQVTNITGEMLSVVADLNNFGSQTGNVEVPVTVSISGSEADSCWVVGTYVVAVDLEEPETALAMTRDPNIHRLPGRGRAPGIESPETGREAVPRDSSPLFPVQKKGRGTMQVF